MYLSVFITILLKLKVFKTKVRKKIIGRGPRGEIPYR